MHKPDVLFVLSIDTEEEWQWEGEFPTDNCSIKNIERLPEFHGFCRKLGIKPTYFVDYPVVNSTSGQTILKSFIKNNEAEIGAHLHPWCNPPYFEKTTEASSHVVNLPTEQVEQKLIALTSLIKEKVGFTPVSFRSGRWGIDGSTIKLLANLGYTVDSSVYPFYDNEFFDCEGSPLIPYWPDTENPLNVGSQRNIMELPVSAGFNRAHFSLAHSLHKKLSIPPFSWLRAIGILWHTKLLRKIYLSPELFDSQNMNSLIDASLRRGHPVIHMYLHSSSLIDGATGLLNVNNAFERICTRIDNSVNYLSQHANVRFCSITEAANLLQQSPATNQILRWDAATS